MLFYTSNVRCKPLRLAFRLTRMLIRQADYIYIGRIDTGDSQRYNFGGQLDEIRMSSTNRSANGLKPNTTTKTTPLLFSLSRTKKPAPARWGIGVLTRVMARPRMMGAGRGMMGTITGAVWKGEEECVSGKCLHMDNVNDAVSIIGVDELGPKAITVAGWVKTVSTNGTLALKQETNVTATSVERVGSIFTSQSTAGSGAGKRAVFP